MSKKHSLWFVLAVAFGVMWTGDLCARGKDFNIGGALILPESSVAKDPPRGKESMNIINLDFRYRWKQSGKNYFEPTLSWNVIPSRQGDYDRADWYLLFPYGGSLTNKLDWLIGPGFYHYRIKSSGSGTFGAYQPDDSRNSRMWAIVLGIAYRTNDNRIGLDTIWTDVADSEDRQAMHVVISVGFGM